MITLNKTIDLATPLEIATASLKRIIGDLQDLSSTVGVNDDAELAVEKLSRAEAELWMTFKESRLALKEMMLLKSQLKQLPLRP